MEMFDGMTYAKGGSVLHMLRGLLGDDAWWKGIRGYVAKHKFQVVETDDFRKAMEEASGKDLKWFFDQWLYKAGPSRAEGPLALRRCRQDGPRQGRADPEARRADPALPPAHDAGNHRGRGKPAGRSRS